MLALIVAASHFNISNRHGFFFEATFAVRAFFVISGFYMAMVICERYAARGPLDFYVSRLLKLLPIYWCVAALTVLAAHGMPWKMIDTAAVPWPILAGGAISLITLIGVDVFPFFALDPANGTLSFAPDRVGGQLPGTWFLPVGQTWSIGLELWFYLLAPFVVRRSAGLIAAILAASIAFRYIVVYALFGTLDGAFPEPNAAARWLNRALFPCELAYFMLGVLAYRLFLLLPATMNARLVMRAALALIVVIICCRALIVMTGPNSAISTVGYLALAAGLPFIFLASKQNRIDSMLGELSYPVYIVHVLIFIMLFNAGARSWASDHGLSSTIVFLLVTVFAAAIIDRLIARPIDRLRVRFGARARNKGGAPSLGAAPIVARVDPVVAAEAFAIGNRDKKVVSGPVAWGRP